MKTKLVYSTAAVFNRRQNIRLIKLQRTLFALLCRNVSGKGIEKMNNLAYFDGGLRY